MDVGKRAMMLSLGDCVFIQWMVGIKEARIPR